MFARGRFIAWDGEGINNADPGDVRTYGHRYVYLASSSGAKIISDEGGLSTREALDTIVAEDLRLQSERIAPIHIAYGLSYDANCILRGLSRDVVEMLWSGKYWDDKSRSWKHADGAVEFSLGRRRFAAQYHKRKSLYVQRFRAPKRRWITNNKGDLVKDVDTLTVWDVQGFFQCSFVDALREHFTAAELGGDDDRLEELKDMRDVFRYDMLESIISYNELELQWLVRLMERARAHLAELDLPVRMWHGSGAIASALINTHKVKPHHEYDPVTHQDKIRRAYFGGRIEIGGIGKLEAPFYHADQNAAYPGFMRMLPSLADAHWLPGVKRNAAMILRRVKFHFPEGIHWYPLPYRSPFFAICFPPRGEGWYWDPEVAAAARYAARFGGNLEVLEAWSIVPVRSDKPFFFVNERFAQRRDLEKKGEMGAAQLLKFGMSSLYGKMAQQIGGRIEDDGTLNLPPLFSQAWAGWITSATRAALVDAALSMRDDKDLVFFSTDGIVSRSPLRVPRGPNLGEWSSDHADEIIVAQPGVYWTRVANDWTSHARGYTNDELRTPHAILAAWRRKEQAYPARTRRFLTMGSALAAAELWPEWCEWRDTPRPLDITGGSSKRHPRRKSGKSPAAGWVPLPPMYSIHYEHTGDVSHPAPLLWDDGEPDETDFEGVNARTVEYEILDAYV